MRSCWLLIAQEHNLRDGSTRTNYSGVLLLPPSSLRLLARSSTVDWLRLAVQLTKCMPPHCEFVDGTFSH
jgi:hypothetical protein